jgi:hypothetical protein
MNQPNPDRVSKDSATSDRRRANRESLDVQVQVHLDTKELTGTANNVSKSGILFFTDGELKVTVQLEENGKQREVTGNLVRCERIKGNHRGWAVEFGN